MACGRSPSRRCPVRTVPTPSRREVANKNQGSAAYAGRIVLIVVATGTEKYRCGLAAGGAAATAGLPPELAGYDGGDPAGFAFDQNVEWLHYSREQRQQVAAAMRAEGMGYRQIAEKLNVDHSTVIEDVK